MNRQDILQNNCSFLQQYSKSLADRLLYQDEEEVRAAVTIQKFYRAHVARKVYSRLLAEDLNREEEEFFQRELERASESTLWLQRSKLKRKLTEKRTIDENAARRREQSATCIQRHWRRWKSKDKYVPVNFDPEFVSILQENFPDICEQYSISSSGMVFSGSSPRTSSLSSHRIVRKIVPNNNNMSLFNDLTTEYTLEEEEKEKEEEEGGTLCARSEFDTPIPAKRPLFETSYVFEKELREDFNNPYYIDSSDDDEEEEEEVSGNKLCSSQSLESRVSEESLGSTAQVCDSGFEDDTRGSSCSLPRPSHNHGNHGNHGNHDNAWGGGEEEYQMRRDVNSRPCAVQMCFVEEVSDDEEGVSEEVKNMSVRDIPDLLSQSKPLTKTSQCSSENNISSPRLGPEERQSPSSKRPRSYGGGDQPDMGQLKEGWRNSAHLMTAHQLRNWLNVMQLNCTKVNMELMEHLAERDQLQEQQDVLLQKIFALKSIKENGGVEPKTEPGQHTPSFKRRFSSFFGR